MSSEENNHAREDIFERANMDASLYALAKECKKISRHSKFTITVVGGASIVLNYNFRTMTTDFDAILSGSKDTFKEAIRKVADQKGYTIHWINDDFKNTESFSRKIEQYSKFYKEFANCVEVRTVSAEYLLAMKIRSARIYKHDWSDIIGIIKEHVEKKMPITYEIIEKAYQNLYECEMILTEDVTNSLKSILTAENLEDLYYEAVEIESTNKEVLNIAQTEYVDLIHKDNVNQFVSGMKNKLGLSTDSEKPHDAGEPHLPNVLLGQLRHKGEMQNGIDIKTDDYDPRTGD